jgi:aromatic-L-amino-acid decarboxylase
LPDAPDALRAIALADSVAIDPHKWLYAPLEAGCALVRDAEALRSAFSFHPPYYTFDGDASDPPLNYHEWGLQNSRGFRALKVWATIRQVGRSGYRTMISDDIRLSREMHRLASEHEEIEALTQSLSISTFRYVPASLRGHTHDEASLEYLNDLNTEILAELQRDGRVYVSNAVIGQTFALRACIVNFRTSSQDVAEVIRATVEIGRRVDAQMQAARGR